MRHENLGAHSSLKHDLTGQRFGRVVVLARSERTGADTLWSCVCDCGRHVDAASAGLRRGRITSCGCQKTIRARSMGLANAGLRRVHPVAYRHWASMIKRCFRAYDVNYHRYGGAGIAVCQGWREFAGFVASMGDPPAGSSVDRIDGRGHYSCGHCAECRARAWPSNCRWATSKQQQRNRSSNRVVAFRGESRCLAEWCEALGMRYITVHSRLRSGWTVEQALSTPVRPKQKTPARG